jgi:succinate-acetate transporter protein
MAAYTDSSTGAISPEFSQALAIYLWAWFIVTVLFTIAAVRSSWVLFLDLFFLDICLLLLACGNMVGSDGVLTAGYSLGLIVCFLSCKSNLPAFTNMANHCEKIQIGLAVLDYGVVE